MEREDNDMDKLNVFKSTGVAAGIIVGLVICVVLFKFMNSDSRIATRYDERQKAVRGKAYMYGFWGCVIAAAAVMVFDIGGFAVAGRFATDFFIIFVGIAVQVAYSVWNDSYYGLNTNKKRFFIVCIVAVALNLFTVIMNIRMGTFIENGMIGDSAVNLMCVILFALIGVEVAVKSIIDGRSESEESGE